jgi:hypothetical protein
MIDYGKLADLVFAQTIEDDESSGLSYLYPNYRIILREMINGGELDLEETGLSFDELCEMCQLEVTRRNTLANRTNAVVRWLDAVVNEVVDPAEDELSASIMGDLVEYMKESNTLAEKKKELDEREAALNKSEMKRKLDKTMFDKLPPGFSLERRKI